MEGVEQVTGAVEIVAAVLMIAQVGLLTSINFRLGGVIVGHADHGRRIANLEKNHATN